MDGVDSHDYYVDICYGTHMRFSPAADSDKVRWIAREFREVESKITQFFNSTKRAVHRSLGALSYDFFEGAFTSRWRQVKNKSANPALGKGNFDFDCSENTISGKDQQDVTIFLVGAFLDKMDPQLPDFDFNAELEKLKAEGNARKMIRRDFDPHNECSSAPALSTASSEATPEATTEASPKVSSIDVDATAAFKMTTPVAEAAAAPGRRQRQREIRSEASRLKHG